MRLLTRPAPVPVAPAVRSIYTLHAAEAGTAIIGSTRTSDDVEVWLIERLPAGLDAAADWLHRTFPDLPRTNGAHVIIDSDALGMALWDLLRVRFRPGWVLYEAQGRARQALTNAALVAMSDRRIHVQPSKHEDALRRALAGLHKTVGEDGVVGSELTTALALAVALRRPSPPRVF